MASRIALFILVLYAFPYALTDGSSWYDKLLQEQRRNLSLKYTKNKWGLRDRDYATPKPPGHFRIIMLGDSFTYGVGVVQDRDTFPKILEEALNSDASANGLEVEVLNGGIPGSLTKDWVALWDRISSEYDPDLVVIVFFLRDGSRLELNSFFDQDRREIAKRNRQSFLYRNFYLYQMAKDYSDRGAVINDYIRTLRTSYLGAAEQTVEWREAERNMLKIKAQASRRDSASCLVIFPFLWELNERYPFKDIGDVVKRFSEASGFPTFDLLPAFLGHTARKLWVSAYDQHPNEMAHQIAAKALLPFLRRLIAEKRGTETLPISKP